MVNYIGEKDYKHGSKEKIGVLITNLGTPDAPNKKELSKNLYCLKTINAIWLLSALGALGREFESLRLE